MSDGRFDALARALAQPMPRRRVIKMIGAALVASAIPAVRSGAAYAAECDYATHYDCFRTRLPEPDHWCCPRERHACGNNPGECVHMPCEPGQSECGLNCCPTGMTCVKPPGVDMIDWYCEIKCAGEPCGDGCCGRDEQCVRGRCVKRCPEGRVRCGGRCCPRGTRCSKGRCAKCENGRRACGNRCCSKGQDCCSDAAGNFVCCDTRRRSCCAVGKTGQRRMTCCPPRTRCLEQFDMTDSGATGGIPRGDAVNLCCPPRRQVGDIGCCPPGHVSLGGKLVVPAGGGGGLCCREDKVCGSGRSITCCSTGAGDAALEQWCVDGRCQRRPA